MQLSPESQTVVPQSFMDLYAPAGRLGPAAERADIAGRHEVCEGLAEALTEHAKTLLARHGVTEQDVMDRVLAGLLAGDSGLKVDEAMWVAHRLAELLEWRDVGMTVEGNF